MGIQKKIAERRQLNLDAFERRRRGGVQDSEPADNNSPVHETDPEALPDYPDHPPTTLPDYPNRTALPDYTDHPSPSAPPAEFVTAAAISGQDEFEAPPSYDVAMRGEF